MNNTQFFSKYDSMREFKKQAKRRFPNCAFYNSPVNNSINMGAGFYNGSFISETIITDGSIALQKKNFERPLVIWENCLLTLENGTSISINIEKATFMINITKYLGQEQVDIHVTEEDTELLQRILNFFYGRQLGLLETSSITFTSPTVLLLESFVNGKRKQESIDFTSGETKQYKKGHDKK